MADERTVEIPSPSTPSAGARSPSAARASEDHRGVTTIHERVVAKIAAIAAREVHDVAGLGGGAGGVVQRMRGAQTNTVDVEVGETECAVDLALRLGKPVAVVDVAERVRRNVIERVESLTGLHVVEVNIGVVDFALHSDEPPQPAGPPKPADGATPP